mmetsp:Transcript_16619/g.56801  ORF Transcript_16619/g.56801 Transcript_16619/m.56801 type:complete len:262 (-) Transcript_16619:681-1466(-)
MLHHRRRAVLRGHDGDARRRVPRVEARVHARKLREPDGAAAHRRLVGGLCAAAGLPARLQSRRRGARLRHRARIGVRCRRRALQRHRERRVRLRGPPRVCRARRVANGDCVGDPRRRGRFGAGRCVYSLVRRQRHALFPRRVLRPVGGLRGGGGVRRGGGVLGGQGLLGGAAAILRVDDGPARRRLQGDGSFCRRARGRGARGVRQTGLRLEQGVPRPQRLAARPRPLDGILHLQSLPQGRVRGRARGRQFGSRRKGLLKV